MPAAYTKNFSKSLRLTVFIPGCVRLTFYTSHTEITNVIRSSHANKRWSANKEKQRRRTGFIGIWLPEAGLNKHTHIHKHEILGLGIRQK